MFSDRTDRNASSISIPFSVSEFCEAALYPEEPNLTKNEIANRENLLKQKEDFIMEREPAEIKPVRL